MSEQTSAHPHEGANVVVEVEQVGGDQPLERAVEREQLAGRGLGHGGQTVEMAPSAIDRGCEGPVLAGDVGLDVGYVGGEHRLDELVLVGAVRLELVEHVGDEGDARRGSGGLDGRQDRGGVPHGVAERLVGEGVQVDRKAHGLTVAL